ncbi:hypothetical protein [Methylobacterium radiotolerans]|uniref:Uncharacterized protein n=1 Tax=Methylobacterium radiotolerans (strain ATCC 27329 / DSM 1819 / JCM 2831 / NBRC 15690 / NCIMB 10815 / 0-1) TaxID=426355 RepID=B1M6C6_METRJ|nr:hypothetical protein [Methylobacterium radiotolerans]ACB23586.1 conserved hypothetical protein [Methylobacterium radiotolerans JCM 2831]KZC01493.1 hypothetical protein AU375_02229 [Methylobacterium radiotolerans]GEM97658.1 hypothetical protein MRA01_21980 [Methylobacterium radiotolerans]
MAEAARRYQQAGGSDLVRRLMARPVRLEQQVRTRMPLRDPRPVDARPEAYAETFADDAEARDEADEIARLEAELQVMKAVLRAQRQEVESLRAQRQLLTESAPTDDVRATRERWAALVDSLLIRAR